MQCPKRWGQPAWGPGCRKRALSLAGPNIAVECAMKRDRGMDEGVGSRESRAGVQAPHESWGLSVVDRSTRGAACP